MEGAKNSNQLLHHRLAAKQAPSNNPNINTTTLEQQSIGHWQPTTSSSSSSKPRGLANCQRPLTLTSYQLATVGLRATPIGHKHETV